MYIIFAREDYFLGGVTFITILVYFVYLKHILGVSVLLVCEWSTRRMMKPKEGSGLDMADCPHDVWAAVAKPQKGQWAKRVDSELWTSRSLTSALSHGHEICTAWSVSLSYGLGSLCISTVLFVRTHGMFWFQRNASLSIHQRNFPQVCTSKRCVAVFIVV